MYPWQQYSALKTIYCIPDYWNMSKLKQKKSWSWRKSSWTVIANDPRALSRHAVLFPVMDLCVCFQKQNRSLKVWASVLKTVRLPEDWRTRWRPGKPRSSCTWCPLTSRTRRWWRWRADEELPCLTCAPLVWCIWTNTDIKTINKHNVRGKGKKKKKRHQRVRILENCGRRTSVKH